MNGGARAVALVDKADWLERQLNAGANEVGIPELIAWLAKRDPDLAAYVEMRAGRANIERVINSIRHWVRAGDFDRAEQEARNYDGHAAHIGELLRARPLAAGRKQLRYLDERRNAGNEQRQEEANRQHALWQEAANDLWARHPHWGNSEVARALISRFPDAKFDTIRRRIRKLARPG